VSMQMKFSKRCKKCGKEFWYDLGEDRDYCDDCLNNSSEKKPTNAEEDLE